MVNIGGRESAALDMALSVIFDIVESANYDIPYSATSQPSDAVARNYDDLLQYQLPGGTALSGYAEPGSSKSMGTAINSLLVVLAPFLSAYGLILPILGVIVGIIEVLCALMNPWSVKKAVKRLMKKWIPSFLSIFPPAAGALIILSTIKLILAIVFFVLTVVAPTIDVIINNMKLLAATFDRDNGNVAQRRAGRDKMLVILVELANQLGILELLKPLLDVIMLVLGLIGKKPCRSGGTEKGEAAPSISTETSVAGAVGDVDGGSGGSGVFPSAANSGSTGETSGHDLTGIARNYDEGDDDTSCCDEEVCPPIIKNPPFGKAYILPTFYADSPPGFAWKIIPLERAQEVLSISVFMQSFKAQLDSQLDETLSEAKYAGQTSDTSHFKVKIISKRGNAKYFEVPISKVDETGTMYVVSPLLGGIAGLGSYEIIPNYDMLFAHNIISMGCDPEIEAASAELGDRFAYLDGSALDRIPEAADIGVEYYQLIKDINNEITKLHNIVLDVVFDDGRGQQDEDGTYTPPGSDLIGAVDTTDASLPPYDDSLEALGNLSDEITGIIGDYANNLKDTMNSILSKVTDKFNATFDVNKKLVRAGGDDKAVVYVIPRDVTGAPLLKNLPSGVNINVSIFTDFGTLGDNVEDRETGAITADLTSALPGVATVTAKINEDFIQEFDSEGTSKDKEIEVRFVSDKVMPKRRLPSKSTKYSTTDCGEREPGGR
jgi:hypothetical protein